jgi:hypothetical protein
MSHNNSGNHGELSLEPMEHELKHDPVFGDFSSRDRGSPASVKKAEASLYDVIDFVDPVPVTVQKRKPTGKANFLTDDRKVEERRKSARRSVVRLTGDRRRGNERRSLADPWDFGSLA